MMPGLNGKGLVHANRTVAMPACIVGDHEECYTRTDNVLRKSCGI